MEEIKSCPFCGSTASVESQFGKEWWVQCDDIMNCGSSEGGLCSTPDEAVQRWNRRAVPQANAEKDALRWRTFEKALHSRLQGPAHGKKIKVVEVCPMYGDEKEVSDIATLIDATIRAASKTTPSSGEGA